MSPIILQNKPGCTATVVACGWADAVIKMANPSIWAGVVMQKPHVNAEKANGDGPTDRQTNEQTDKAAYRVACTRLKIDIDT